MKLNAAALAQHANTVRTTTIRWWATTGRTKSEYIYCSF